MERKKYLYGVPSIYFLTAKGKSLIQVGTRIEKVKIEQIVHDRTVLDTAIYFMHKENLSLQDITTEKQLHQSDGFGIRKHRADFIFTKDELTNCVEVELTKKANNRLLNADGGRLLCLPVLHKCHKVGFVHLMKQKSKADWYNDKFEFIC